VLIQQANTKVVEQDKDLLAARMQEQLVKADLVPQRLVVTVIAVHQAALE
jgi:hypothetical protein